MARNFKEIPVEIQPRQLPFGTMVVLGLFSLGVAPWAIWRTMRRWPARVDEQGMTLRNGTHIPWTDFTQIRKVDVMLNGRKVSERFDLRSPQGKVSIVPDRLFDGNAVANYVWEQLPAAVTEEALAA